VPVELLVLLAGLIPVPGEAPRDWATNTGYQPGGGEWSGDVAATFYHDLPPELAAEALRRGRAQSDTPTQQPWPLTAWPDVSTRFLLCRDHRLLPADFLRRVVRERLGIDPDEIEGGHCVALSRPKELPSGSTPTSVRRSGGKPCRFRTGARPAARDADARRRGGHACP
jgi:hypothetical protein